MKSKTIIIVSHRLTTVQKADIIYVLEDGVIAEQGTHDGLLEQNGVYRELYETQFKRVLEHEAEQNGTRENS